MKDIKDYLHFYIESPVEIYNGEATIVSNVTGTTIDMARNGRWKAKLILRKLIDMTIEEQDEIGILLPTRTRWDVEQFQWLLARSFDLFGLIESGISIDKTKYFSNQTVKP